MNRHDHIPLGAGGREFDMIRRLLDLWGPLAAGIGSDAAALRIPDGAQLITSVDTTVEDVHFRRTWMTPREVGYRSVASALSDLAAAACEPIGVMLAMNLSPSWQDTDTVLQLGEGIADAVKACGDRARIVGGDTTRANEFALCVTVMGFAHSPLGRRGARAGDIIFVTGDLGRSRRALEALQQGKTPRSADRERFVHPLPRLREGRWLAQNGATSAIDISDGLVSELNHLAAASDKRLVVDLDRLHVTHDMDPVFAAGSGEEYELLVTAPAQIAVADFEREFSIPLTRIGRVENGASEVAINARGRQIPLPEVGGFSHF